MKTKTKQKVSPDLEIRDRAIQLTETLYQTYYELSLTLSEIYHSRLYELWGFANINEYFEQELKISYRAGMYHVQIGDTIKKLNISKDMLTGIGWSKFKEAIKIINEDTTLDEVEEIISEIKDLSTRETENYIRKKKEEKASEKVVMNFTFIKEQAEVVEKAIEIARELLGIPEGEGKSRCIEYICLEFQSNYNPEISEYIKKMMVDDEKLKKAQYKERVDKGKRRKENVKTKNTD
jgi:hypothetical protein